MARKNNNSIFIGIPLQNKIQLLVDTHINLSGIQKKQYKKSKYP